MGNFASVGRSSPRTARAIPVELPDHSGHQTLCRQWAQVRVERQSAGRAISPQDAWIAATALRHDLPLVTHNIKDFLGISNLRLITP